jgi:hypothetical protein
MPPLPVQPLRSHPLRDSGEGHKVHSSKVIMKRQHFKTDFELQPLSPHPLRDTGEGHKVHPPKVIMK